MGSKEKSRQKLSAEQREARIKAAAEREARARAVQERSARMKKVFTVVVAVILILGLTIPTVALSVLGSGA
ncbi:MAG: CASC3 protein CASC3 [Berryella intestinalis]|uniref:CASC3 protein CASC3 n=1 Tax=Berryella intestinalis TaxID=1531429 RepID=UPI002A57052D|nr:CASC3 protein CASC3 [Berryella intestinalis]MDD7369706.1 CASC3 protein CASC3 [Berryella intestinalis]MDY3128585.1 CASC3 protein CASC3 [Berryella intestinalis]